MHGALQSTLRASISARGLRPALATVRFSGARSGVVHREICSFSPGVERLEQSVLRRDQRRQARPRDGQPRIVPGDAPLVAGTGVVVAALVEHLARLLEGQEAVGEACGNVELAA